MIFYNGTRHVIVGVISFNFGCANIGQMDGFARVTHQIDWIIENGDDYVKKCSGKNVLATPSANSLKINPVRQRLPYHQHRKDPYGRF